MKALVVFGKIVLTFAICTGLSAIFNVLMMVFIDAEEMPHILNGPKSFFVILGAVILMLLIFKKDRSLSLGLAGNRKPFLLLSGSLYGIVLVLVSFIAVFIVGEADFESFGISQAIFASMGVAAILALCDSITEEILFRGYIQEMIKRSFGIWSGIIISAIPFAALHALGHDVLSNPLVLINLALAGVFLALLREMTGSLWLPIGFHFAWNTVNRFIGTEDSLIQIQLGPNEWISGGSQGFDAGLANTLIMTTLIVVCSFWLSRVRKSS
ncbi:CPBP family intramembrane glutamic endopeptidase [Paenibacillus xylaniclasticus]|uniref:CPBP family intramembrane glutamic endopeptidase n=1 Tax=Paenibacillus xylaniclasticus TaxID=588083 RepID=UPI000FD94F54|nr:MULTISPECIES: CPBP family intramembrane glutamic endopeptidase [Paenibacillus]GFN29785.1 transporter [Paenibacillus curdlanolyticus]